MEKMPQRALKCLISQTDTDTHLYIHNTRDTHALARTHTYTRTHVEKKHRSTTHKTLSAHTKTIHLPIVNK